MEKSTEKPSEHERTKMNSLQGLRALAFLGIFSSHCGIFDFGGWGVSVFLVLSGFLMVYNYLERGGVLEVQ